MLEAILDQQFGVIILTIDVKKQQKQVLNVSFIKSSHYYF